MGAKREDDGHVVLDNEQRAPASNFQDQRYCVLGLFLGHPGHGLVEQDHLGIRGKRHADLERTLFRVRQDACRRVAMRLQAKMFHESFGFFTNAA